MHLRGAGGGLRAVPPRGRGGRGGRGLQGPETAGGRGGESE